MRVRAIRVREAGGPEGLRMEELEVGRPGPGQALVRHEAIGVNFIDVYQRTGLYPVEPPFVPGVEAAGVVEEIGEEVEGLQTGDRVAYAGGAPGAYAEARLIEAWRLVPVPDGVDGRTAAAVLLRGMTVEYLVRRAFGVQPGMTVLWHAAAGGVGLIACQWLSRLGARVIGTAGSREKTELARRYGCDHVVNYRENDFVAAVAELTNGQGVPVAYDSVGKDTLQGSMDCLATRGCLVAFGNASGPPDPVNPRTLADRGSLYLTRPRLFDYVGTREELLASAGALFDLVLEGAVEPVIGQEWDLGEAGKAQRALEERRTTGSSILVP